MSLFDATVDYDADERGLSGPLEIVGAEAAPAVKATIEKARDNRQPAPAMKAVPVDAPEQEDDAGDILEDIIVGAAVCCHGEDQFPITSKFMTRFSGGSDEPRYVRIDTEQSYAAFRASQSPELAALKQRVEELSAAFARHAADPLAHELLEDEVAEVDVVGAEVAQAEGAKKIDLWLPKWADGKIHAWREGDFVCASMKVPGYDGEVRICTSMTPVVKCMEEMTRHAAEAKVNGAEIVGVLPAMGCCLGAGTLVKEMASATPAILQQPEAKTCEPFVCRIEPKAKPSLCALIALYQECACGNKQACDEWAALADAAQKGGADPLAKAMREAADCFRRAAA
jgi:hypothetical protein